MSLNSGQTRAAGKGGKEKTTKLPRNVKQNNTEQMPHKVSDSSKVQATAEQIRMAQLISDGKQMEADPELQAKVTQVMELTGRTSDEVSVALHDCDNDVTKAVNMLLEGSQDQGEWEMSGKKKKSRQNVAAPKSHNPENAKNGNSGNNKENKSHKQDRNHDNKDREVSRNRGPPRLNRGKGWRGRESEKNEKNLEEDQNRGGTSQRGARAVNGRGGRGGGRGGPRSRTFENKSAAHDSFPRSIDTWTNSTAEQADGNAGVDSTMTVGNWSDFKTEDWSDGIDDWSESLNETKVFTPSGTTNAQAKNSAPINNTSESINLATLLQQKQQPTNNMEDNALLNQPGQNTYINQYQQKTSAEGIKSVAANTGAPLSSAETPSGYSVGQNLNYRSPVSQNMNVAQKYSNVVTQQQRLPINNQPQLTSRSKLQRTRLPPPSKIPASAVEMPDDSVGGLDVQFSGLEFGTESSGFEITSNNDSSNHYVSASPTAPTIQNHRSSSATNQSMLSTSNNAYSANSDLNSGSVSIAPPVTQSLSQINQRALGQSQKMNSNNDDIMMSSQSGDANSAYSASRASQPPGIDVGSIGSSSKQDASSLGGFGTSTSSVMHQNSNMGYQASYKNSSSLASSNGGSNYSSLSSTQKSYNQPNNPSSYAQPSSISSTYSANQSDQSAYSVPDQTSNYQSQYQSSAFQPASCYAGANTTYTTSNSVSSYGAPSKISSSLSSDTSSLNQNSQSTFENSVSSSVENINTGSSTLSSNSSVTSSSSNLPASSINASGLGLTSNALAISTSTISSGIKSSALSSGKSVPSLPPGVPAVLGHHPFIMSQAGLPFYASYYDMPFQPPTSINAGRDGGLSNVSYTGSDGKFSRGDSNSSPIPTSLSQQSSQQHQQFINHTAAALPPGYGNYYYAVGNVIPGSFPQYSPIYPVPPATNAHGATTNTQFQKPGAYGSHTYSSASGVSVGSSAGSDMSGSVYNKPHNQLSKFDKAGGYHGGTPPPFNLASGVTAGAGHQTAGGPLGTPPSGPYGTPSTPYLQMMTHPNISPAMLTNLQPDISASSQRSAQTSSQQKGGAGSSAKAYQSPYWGSS